jgi:hypothetical protein
MKAYPRTRGNKKSVFKKLALFAVLIVAPVIVIMIVFGLLASSKERARVLEQYRLPVSYVVGDYERAFLALRKDSEFSPYFQILNQGQLTSVTQKAWKNIDESRTQDDLFKEMELLVSSVRKKANFFLHLDYPENFAIAPDNFPQLKEALNSLIETEFQLSVLGAVYKSTYDNNFIFKWDSTSKEAAQKAFQIFQKIIKNTQKKNK